MPDAAGDPAGGDVVGDGREAERGSGGAGVQLDAQNPGAGRGVASRHHDWVEPWGEDYWMKPEEQFTITCDAPVGVDSDEAPFDVVFHDQGASIEVNTGYGAVVHDQSGAELICGHQRPLEVFRAWIEADEAAVQ
ncbi:hypothetical protein [Streptomyces sp. 147326]|uniref:hypothetical protein n=1 Tax=Streptomyces sp. 147326 TaxID=3074379 RepID=UPI003857A465